MALNFRIENQFLSRTLEVSAGGLRMTSFVNKLTGRDYVHFPVFEFMFTAGERRLVSYSERHIREVDGKEENADATMVFEGARQDTDTLELDFSKGDLAIAVCYRLFPNVAGMEKHLRFTNRGNADIKLEKLVFDNPCIAPGGFPECDFYRGQQDVPAPICFYNDGNEDIVRCHNPKLNEGWILGSSAPGILRYFMAYPHWQNIFNGYSNGGAPFAKFLAPGESFATDSSLLAVYAGDCHESESFRDLVRAVLPPLQQQEGIMYCSWLPFMTDISEKLIDQLADNASDLGFTYLVLDDGWFAAPGDHQVDPAKFPNGMEAVSEHVRSKGLKFGLWLNIGTNYGNADFNHAWVTKLANGSERHLGFDDTPSNHVMCFATEHRDYVLNQLDELCNKYSVSYFKLDFSSVFSPYGILPWGCHATDHAFHHGWNDSFIEMYRGMKYMRDELKRRHPDLLVDFSFECFGTDVPNIAALQYSEIHHVSNTSANKTDYCVIDRVRRQFYQWLTKLPPERILNGLLTIQGERGPEYLLSSLAGAPLVAGNLMELDDGARKRIKCFTKAFADVTKDGPLTEFKVLESSEERDGFMRYAKDGRGVLCLFNRTDATVTFRAPEGFDCVNAENNDTELKVPANDCALFITRKAVRA